jgi:uncharacterized protein (UPF0332 family)/predicted nucleotidyltransferase
MGFDFTFSPVGDFVGACRHADGAVACVSAAAVSAIFLSMATKAQDNRILNRFRAALDEMYGRRLERVVLFGSRARGDARPDSDYDVAVFLDAVPGSWAELNRLADPAGDFPRRDGRLLRRQAVSHDGIPGRSAAHVRGPPRRGRPVTPQAGKFLEKAEKLLAEAETMLGVGLSDAAGRTASLAGFHAAQAFIFEATRRVLKTHKGVQTEFLRLTKDNGRLDADLRAFLSRAYELKSIADYETGPNAEVSAATATEAVSAGKRFVARLAELPPRQALSSSRDGRTKS